MIIAIIYEILFILPVTIFGLKISSFYFLFVPERKLPYLISALIVIICSVFINLDKMKKIVVTVVTVILSLGAAFIFWKKDKFELFYENEWIGWVALFSVIFFIVCKLVLYSNKLKIVLAASILGYLIYAMLMVYRIPDSIVGMALLEIIMIVSYLVEYYWKKEGKKEIKKHIVFISPFLIIMSLIVIFIPSPRKPFGWEFAKEVWNKASLYTVSISEKLFHSNEEDYDNASIGFSDSGILANSAYSNDKDILSFHVNRKKGSKIYLTGCVFDSFENGVWNSTYAGNDNSHLLDTLETMAAADIYSHGQPTDYLLRENYKIKFLPFTTKNVFVPLKTTLFEYDDKKMEIDSTGNTFSFGSLMGMNTEYLTKSYRLNIGNDDFKNFANSNVGIDKTEWRKTLLDSGVISAEQMERKGIDNNINYDSLLEYRNDVYKYYLPETDVSDNMRTFIDEVTKNADNDYDKLLCIEKVLMTYEYNLNPGKIPESVDTTEEYLDYIVLSSKKGYCSHYATAFTLIARYLGHPARYVQGYTGVIDENGNAVVKSNNAHAWPEVYFDGMGWIPFEPTPGQKSVSKWTTSKDLREYFDQLSEKQEEEVVVQSVPEIEIPEIEVENMEDTIKIEWYYFVIPVVASIIFVLIFMVFDIIVLRKKILGKNEYDKVKGMCRWNMKVLNLIGAPIEEGETLAEYYERIIRFLPSEAVLFIPYYEDISYSSNMDIEKTVVEDVVKSNKILLNELKNNNGLLYFINYFKSVQLK